MKVYTHFYPINGKEGFRWRTLLQFGDTWNCIGTVVMKNPGSSNGKLEPITDTIILDELYKYHHSDDEWYEFDADSTMNCVGDLFAYKLDAQRRENLSGVIQIFNLFYVREADLSTAIDKSKEYGIPCHFTSVEEMTLYDVQHLVPPVYLGFSDLARSKEFVKRARMFYDAVKKLDTCNGTHAGDYLEEFDKNPYIHPQYLMLFGKSKSSSIIQRLKFKQNTTNPIGLEDVLSENCSNGKSRTNIDKNRITAEVVKGLQLNAYEAKNNRYILNHKIGITISSVEKGFIGIRYIVHNGGYNNSASQFVKKLRALFESEGYDVSNDAWIARKSFASFGHSDETVISAIQNEILKLICYFAKKEEMTQQ